MIYGQGIYAQRRITRFTPGDGITTWSTGGTVSASLGEIHPTTAVKAWDARGGSFGFISASTDCTLIWNITATPFIDNTLEGAVMGFAFSNTHSSLGAIEYGIRPTIFGSTKNLQIREDGGATVVSYPMDFFVGDELKIRRAGSGYTYYHNGALFHTSINPSTSALYFSCVINEVIGAENISLSINH